MKTKSMRGKVIVASLSIVLILAGLLGAYTARNHTHGSEESDDYLQIVDAVDSREPVTVRVHKVHNAQAFMNSYTGVIKARHESDLAFRVGGKIIERRIELGDKVEVGQTLAKLDPTDYELAVKLCEADVVSATAEAANFAKELIRQIALVKSNSTSQSELDRIADGGKAADARLDRAQRALSLAENRLAYCVLKADADGIVTKISSEKGEVVSEGRPIITVAQTDEIEAVISFPENRTSEARSCNARAHVWGDLKADFEVTLRELSPIADPQTRTYQARYSIPSPSADLALGRTITVQLKNASKQTSFSLPLTAIAQHNGQPSVWRVNEGRLTSVPVAVDRYLDDTVVVSQGVQSGELIVAAGVQKLDSSLKVQIWGATK